VLDEDRNISAIVYEKLDKSKKILDEEN